MSSPEVEILRDPVEMTALTLANQAFELINAKYGPEGQNPKGYHNVVHSHDVVGATTTLCDLAIANRKITPKDKALLIISGAFHDFEQDLGSGLNEVSSALAAREAMRNTGVFTPLDEVTVEEVILATQIHYEDGVMLQAATKDNLLAQIVADADLAALGRETEIFWDRSVGLYAELCGDNPTIENQITFLETTAKLLRNHDYYTDEARELFPHQAANLAYVEIVLSSLVRL